MLSIKRKFVKGFFMLVNCKIALCYCNLLLLRWGTQEIHSLIPGIESLNNKIKIYSEHIQKKLYFHYHDATFIHGVPWIFTIQLSFHCPFSILPILNNSLAQGCKNSNRFLIITQILHGTPCTPMSSPIILFNNDKNDDLFHRRNYTIISSSRRRNILHPWEKRKDSNNDASAAHSFTM